MEGVLAFVTDLADQGVVLPLMAAIAALLVLRGFSRLALGWLATAAGVFGAILVLKAVCYVCSAMFPLAGLQQAGLISPSGHVASACVVYGGIVAMALGPRGERPIRLPVAISVAVALVIGATRVALGDHTWTEAVVGAAVGIAGTLAFARFAATQTAVVPSRFLMAAVLPVLLLFHGCHFSIEQTIHSASARILATNGRSGS